MCRMALQMRRSGGGARTAASSAPRALGARSFWLLSKCEVLRVSVAPRLATSDWEFSSFSTLLACC